MSEKAAASGVASQRVAEHLRNMILSGELAPGARIRQEDVAARLGASRLPVREALRILAAEGLAVLKSNTGAWVSKLDLNECEGVYKIRERIEPLALAESIPNLTPEDIAHLERLQAEIEDNTDVDRFLRLDRELHLATYAGCHNRELTSMVHRFWNTTQHYRRAYARVIDSAGQQLINFEHRLIIEAVKRADTVDAERFLTGHIRRTRLELAKHPELFAEDEHD
ncbi:DNA-binding transcriptional regulator, GntR family [Saccharopolyspora antimicrobica]|uniref:DNA-binding transcriptional regulator, GntR family n=1 Tax=Saccharopolyspora antimicrobica TaxID=455193 RepID=A0A1I4W7R8_9PSEU|nr:GntR family transcriptional regulator [Saccharopolyspora antimicrobica]RKT87026.1 GntR family transcriptional regulator [Saccharopolyspora antimicrobica]SFN09463.1 DNA-binding transcriptional regulator, GntR family [Saccharopolyspora antimicrobica]